MQTLGVCVCTVGWAGSDCSSMSDPNSMVWETLLDTQLTAVRDSITQNVLLTFYSINGKVIKTNTFMYQPTGLTAL